MKRFKCKPDNFNLTPKQTAAMGERREKRKREKMESEEDFGKIQHRIPHCPDWVQNIALVLAALAIIKSFFF